MRPLRVDKLPKIPFSGDVQKDIDKVKKKIGKDKIWDIVNFAYLFCNKNGKTWNTIQVKSTNQLM